MTGETPDTGSCCNNTGTEMLLCNIFITLSIVLPMYVYIVYISAMYVYSYVCMFWMACIPSTMSSAVALSLIVVRLASKTPLDVRHTYTPWSPRCTFSITSRDVTTPVLTSVPTCTTRTTDVLAEGVSVVKSSRESVSLPENLLQ